MQSYVQNFIASYATNQIFYILLHYKQVSLFKRFTLKNAPKGERLPLTNKFPKQFTLNPYKHYNF